MKTPVKKNTFMIYVKKKIASMVSIIMLKKLYSVGENVVGAGTGSHNLYKELKMKTGIQIKREIVTFIKKNGWEKYNSESNEFDTYFKNNNIDIDINTDEVVLVGDGGDFAHIPINGWTLYTLIGFLFHRRYIPIDYKF
jgi:hypothetical protein